MTNEWCANKFRNIFVALYPDGRSVFSRWTFFFVAWNTQCWQWIEFVHTIGFPFISTYKVIFFLVLNIDNYASYPKYPKYPKHSLVLMFFINKCYSGPKKVALEHYSSKIKYDAAIVAISVTQVLENRHFSHFSCLFHITRIFNILSIGSNIQKAAPQNVF